MTPSIPAALMRRALLAAGLGLAGLASAAEPVPTITPNTVLPYLQLASLDLKPRPSVARASDEEMMDGMGGVPCQGYYIIWVNNQPVKIWYPSGCTPP